MNRRFGKHARKNDYRTFRLRSYLDGAVLAPPPAACDPLAIALGRARQPLGQLFPMDGNDQYGDCTIAALAHQVTLDRALTGSVHVPTAAQVEKAYFTLTGGVDSGLNMLDVLNYWRKHAVGGDKILAFAAVDAHNHAHVKQTVHLFNSAYIGFQVPAGCIEQFDAGQPWVPGPLTNDGHAVLVTGYDDSGVTVLTWGGKQKGTWAWWDECVDEVYAVLPPEASNRNFSPGFSLAKLQADLARVAN